MREKNDHWKSTAIVRKNEKISGESFKEVLGTLQSILWKYT
jgi:hypothetical protein